MKFTYETVRRSSVNIQGLFEAQEAATGNPILDRFFYQISITNATHFLIHVILAI